MIKTITRRTLLTAAAATPFLSLKANAAPAPVLVELFTSQGCSSCPPADRIAGQLAGRDDVIVVSMNVDYWDYIGWKDTLAKPEFTKRQTDYASARGDGQVYTPQMVINGAAHVVGSNASAVDKAVSAAVAAPVPISIATQGNEIVVSVGDGTSVPEATLWLMAIAPAISVDVERGENAGSTIIYHRVVRNLVPAGMWTGKAKSITLPRAGVMTKDSTKLLAVLQTGMTGQLLGLAQENLSAA
jgi:hypothetical protein